MGQTNNTISYHHRQSIDSSLMNPPQAKSKLKKRAPIPQSQDTDLFGKEFRQHLVESVKVKNNQRMCLSKYLRNIITWKVITNFQEDKPCSEDLTQNWFYWKSYKKLIHRWNICF